MSNLKEMKILYIEDDEESREALRIFLKRRCGKILTASDGENGFDFFINEKPDILIIDILLPGISGLELIRKIRKHTSTTPILITSTVKNVNTILDAVDLKIDTYIIKPIDILDLEAKLNVAADTIYNEKLKSNQQRYCSVMENKGLIEDSIRQGFLKFLKNYSGKGPDKAIVYLDNNTIEITAYNTLTLMEKSIISNKKNIGLVEQNREMFYKATENMLSSAIEETSGFKTSLSSCRVSIDKKTDKLLLTII